ncbi:protease complex subunit PrcB family protein [Anaeromicropila populeti]|uniref:PrcB C-terminal n=1 Tax=Anaeromicropila populeti TaxID=37658 RepID=A0A1I6I652_9FIRM|nr:protease complex subunit PrcB family protein [Anaeromicropila populeti]SFR62118.1 PrcB C-terminal [Anaeromicropila populeti]
MKKTLFIILAGLFIVLLSACKTENTAIEKLRDLEFTVVEDVDLSDELKSMIEEKKAQPFKMSYANGEYLYIVVGYGEQKTGGFSIQVNELYETENAVYIDTTLLGPSKEDMVSNALTYPYVVVKTEFVDKNVVFN